MKIGIATQDESRERTLAIARGECKPRAGEPKYWFHSVTAAEAAIASGRVQVDGAVDYVDLNGQVIPKP
jgi:predicted transcriptional regulator